MRRLLSFFVTYALLVFFFFFFSSRRRHTRCGRDWSSDVCSSDLDMLDGPQYAYWYNKAREMDGDQIVFSSKHIDMMKNDDPSDGWGNTNWYKKRSEERRVGKECRSQWGR